jgi:hypothetical protein
VRSISCHIAEAAGEPPKYDVDVLVDMEVLLYAIYVSISSVLSSNTVDTKVPPGIASALNCQQCCRREVSPVDLLQRTHGVARKKSMWKRMECGPVVHPAI